MEARYRLTARLGAGPLADTFCAQRDESVAVVIKLFQAGTADEQYAKEVAEMAHKLRPYQIPGILQVLDIGFIAGRLAVVRQADGGYNLGQVLSRMAAWGIIFPTPLALWILSELLDTVRRAHAAGVVHGGITPGNIFLCANGQPALCDFGALQALLGSPELKARFALTGRGSYRSREVERGEAATHQSDVFSLGAVGYQLLTLREVSSGRADSSSPGAAPSVGSQIDQRLYPLLMKSMEAIPQLRYPSCADFAEGLQKYLAANCVSPTRQALQKFLGDLFPEGVVLPSSEGSLPFGQAFSLEPIQGGGFEPGWCASPVVVSGSERVAAPASPIGLSPGEHRPEPAASSLVDPADVVAAEHLAAPAPPRSADAWSSPPIGAANPPMRIPAPERQGRRTQAMALVASLLIAGSFAIALSIRSGTAPASKASPVVAAEVSSPAPPTPADDETPLQPRAGPPVKLEPLLEWDSPPRKGAGFLTVSSRVPSIVYVDGRRVRQPAPLKRYPVQAGVRKISVVAADTLDRRDFTLRFNRGQSRRLDKLFDQFSAER
ncbi:MAG TPA: protein kinase [Myxococcaceae bacterium]|nr:protein kinase [Myxococcaceae bacterium]